MTSVTIRVLEGMEKGRVYSRLKLPVSVGREDENSIQLNDDRISRFHAKLQDHSGRVILTDLTSTNGTRVNGHWIQMRILQVGDVISVGRCLLLFAGKQDEHPPITASDDPDPFRTAFVKGGAPVDDDSKHLDFLGPIPGVTDEPADLFPSGLPELPTNLDTLQHVQLSDLLSYIHERIGLIIRNAKEEVDITNHRTMRVDWNEWSKLVSLHADLSGYISEINTTER